MFAPHRLQILCAYKFLETHDYFQNININKLFILNNFLFYAKHRSMFTSHPLQILCVYLQKHILCKYMRRLI